MVLLTQPEVWVLAGQDDKESKPLTTFTIGPLGSYKCDRMAFRLSNAPATLQWLMEICPRASTSIGVSSTWMIVIFFSKDLARHLDILEAMFQNLEQAGLKLKGSKYELFQWQITYLGHIISAKEIATNETKIDAIKKWPTPTNVTEVQSFWVLWSITDSAFQSSHR